MKEILQDIPKNQPIWCGEWGEDSFENLQEIKKLLNNTPNVCGTAFRTWKRVYDNNNHIPLCTVKTSSDWKRCADWIAYKIFKPRKNEIQRGINDYLRSIQLENCTFISAINNIVK
ncbi:MAG: hypothetical protein C4308_01330 [Chitinophagaceae bacterium]